MPVASAVSLQPHCAVRAQIRGRGPCLPGSPSHPRQETHQGEIIGKGRDEDKSYWAEHLPECEGVFISWRGFGFPLSGVRVTQTEVSQCDGEFTEQLWKESCLGNSKQEGKPRTHLRSQQQIWCCLQSRANLRSFHVCDASAD